MSFFRRFTLSPIILSLTLGAVSGLTLETVRPGAAWVQTDLSSQADRLLDEGIQLYRVSQGRQALENWQQALDLYRQAGDRAGKARALGNIGSIYRLLGDYPQPKKTALTMPTLTGLCQSRLCFLRRTFQVEHFF